MELEFNIYYLSPNAFIYIVSVYFFNAEYEVHSLITWGTFSLSKDRAILV